VTEKCKILLKKHLSMCLRFSFLLHVTLQASTRKQFWSSPDCEQRLLAKCFIFYLLVFLLLVPIAYFGLQLRIAFEIIKCIRHPTS